MKKTPLLHYRFYFLFSNIFQKQFFRSLALTTLGSGAILSLFIWMVQSLRFCAMMAYRGLTLVDVFWLSLHLLPRTAIVGMSWGFVIAILWVYHRWKQENALDVMKSCGVSPWFFNQPTFILSLFLSAVLYIATLYVIPITARLSAEHSTKIHGRFDPSFITAGIYCSFPGALLYAHHHPSRYILNGVFLHHYQDKNKEFMICSQSARIRPHKNGFLICFENGNIQMFPHHAPPYLAHFKHYTFHHAGIEKKDFSARTKPEEWPLDRLWQNWIHREKNPAQMPLVQKEIAYRLFYPALPMVDALWIPLLILYSGPMRWVLFFMPVFLHIGLVSSWAGWVLCIGCLGRWIFWIYTRKNF